MAKNLTPSKGEGETPLDDLSGLKADITKRGELDTLEFQNNLKAYQKYFLKPLSLTRIFTHRGLLRIHQEMFGEVWSWAGEKRKSGKNLGPPPAKVGFEINRLLFDFHRWEKSKIEPIEIAARLHQRLVWIHPFENGNGRWARMAANLYLHGKGLPLIQWPTDQEFVKKVFKPAYLSALRAADGGDHGPLLKLHQQYWNPETGSKPVAGV